MGQLTQKQILVTGGAGFIGSNLCEALLKSGNTVRCLDNLFTGKLSNIEDLLQNPSFEFIEGDIRDFATCLKAAAGVDIVLHQAALGSVPRSIEDPITTNDINISGFLNVLKAATDNEIKRFVYAASSSTYGDHEELPKVEERIGKPLSPYAVSKYVNELYAKVFSDLYGIETIGLRYFNVFGKQQDPDGAYAAAIPKFIRSFMKHESPVIHGDGLQTRDFTYIENVIQANILAATIQNPKALNTVYNVAYGNSTNLLDLVTRLRDLLSTFDAEIAGVSITHGPDRVGDVRNSLADISKAKNLLGYAPEYDFNRGIELAINWYWQNYSH
jgi:UDP-N-acetylglucosamine/UDP-N-acetylgalactosamine 4-epimerase